MPEISYCQGMNFVASVLIAEAGEELGFHMTLYLLLKHEMKTLFLPVSLISDYISVCVRVGLP